MKYPRTLHVPWSLGSTNDDKFVSEEVILAKFSGQRIIITEKRDGENTTMKPDKIHARSLDSNNHPSRNWVKGLWGSIKHEIPTNWRICGENLYAKHSISYDNLTSYFEVFNIWDGEICLSWGETVEYTKLFDLQHVPVLYDGIFDYLLIKNFHNQLNLDIAEGYVIRTAESFHYNEFNQNVFKWVRKNHVQTTDHWMSAELIPNVLTSVNIHDVRI